MENMCQKSVKKCKNGYLKNKCTNLKEKRIVEVMA